MSILVPSTILLLLCYFSMRYLKLFWEKRKLPTWSRYFLGILAWGTLLSFFGFSGSVLYLVFLVVRDGEMGAIIGLTSLVLGAGLFAKYANANPELFEYESMKPFLKDSLAFADPARKTDDIFIELDRHEIRRVHKEVTGKELHMTEGTDRLLEKKLQSAKPVSFSADRRVETPHNGMTVLNQPIASLHLTAELAQLKKGMITDVSDSWKINTLKKKNHEWFERISRVEVDPEAKVLRVSLESEQFTEQRIRRPESLYRFKQELYEFMLAVHDLAWTEPYRRFADRIECTCVSLEIDAFRGRSVQPLLMAEISLKELAARADGFYNAGELKTTILRPVP